MMRCEFDSQNTSCSVSHYPNWNLWVSGIPVIGFRGWLGTYIRKPVDTIKTFHHVHAYSSLVKIFSKVTVMFNSHVPTFLFFWNIVKFPSMLNVPDVQVEVFLL